MAKLPKGMKAWKEPNVLDGEFVFYLADTRGFPLEEIIVIAQDHKCFIDWPRFYWRARGANWSDRRINDIRTLVNVYYTEQWVKKTFNVKRILKGGIK